VMAVATMLHVNPTFVIDAVETSRKEGLCSANRGE
jgi:hypothetical protein